MIQSSYATSFTRTGDLDLTNRKPYRTIAQRKMARATAKRDDRGVWHSSAPVSYHKGLV